MNNRNGVRRVPVISKVFLLEEMDDAVKETLGWPRFTWKMTGKMVCVYESNRFIVVDMH